ncbi:hypothetical protein DY000_02047941 [Brassica cretica]|uniref:Phosphoribosylaminoimidazolesuccinocarboxamide synthase n=1 Tax=Brassica cretica TaxID=69181 RepID=A0ABQ7F6L0_BRACR|nr:hypothetical protein DY000_02047941 [Brassica cretica]
MDFRPRTRRLNGLSSRNPEAGWTIVQEPDGCVDLQGDLLVYFFDSKSPPSGRPSLIARYWSSVFLYQNLGSSPVHYPATIGET